MANGLGRVGVWSRELRFHEDRGAALDAARELEALGYGAAWIPDVGGPVLEACAEILDATESIAVATGIVNIWMHEAGYVARGRADLERDHPGRFTLGLGASHAPVVDADSPGRYAKPYSAMRTYLEELDLTEPPVPAAERILAALGPRMMELSRDRAAGAHPYLVTVEQTAAAREVLGTDRVLAPELSVVLDDDRAGGLAKAREHLAGYLTLPNYTANFKRAGFEDGDLADGGSDRLIEAIVAIGDESAIASRVGEHLAAGADHVCVQVVHAGGDEYLALPEWRRLALPLLEL